MKSMFVLMDECAKELVDYLKEQQNGLSVEIEIRDMFRRYSADVIASIAFGIKCNSFKDRDNEFITMGTELTNFGGMQKLRRLLYSAHPFVKKIFNLKMHPNKVATFFRTLIKTTIEYRKREKSFSIRFHPASFGITWVQEIEHFPLKLTDDDITAQALDFFYGGLYSTTSLIVSSMYELASNLDVQKNLMAEENEGKLINYDALIRMKYLDMVISETLRKWATATWIDRKSCTAITIEPKNDKENSLYLEPGTICWIPVFAIHRDPKYWPEPEKFDPERFNEKNKAKIQSFTFLPFGSGPRNCIGSRFAVMVAKLAIFRILSQYEVKSTEDHVTKKNSNLTLPNNIVFEFKNRRKIHLSMVLQSVILTPQCFVALQKNV
ncbi:hypothetical protein NQ317_010959 [Molorchus minor]|uniref:Cytochrome P450 n=1 Tax=Molorchus minor TaxID=1323400 RepID=A0ABQ9JUW2_9CUCU|nr:hypothetical protein NQ317_010959 [Molorchus minor]